MSADEQFADLQRKREVERVQEAAAKRERGARAGARRRASAARARTPREAVAAIREHAGQQVPCALERSICTALGVDAPTRDTHLPVPMASIAARVADQLEVRTPSMKDLGNMTARHGRQRITCERFADALDRYLDRQEVA